MAKLNMGNTNGYSQTELDIMNAIINKKIKDLDPDSTTYKSEVDLICERVQADFNRSEPNQYRYDSAYNKLYEWDLEQNAYIFVCSNPFNLSEQKLIKEYEKSN